MLKAVPSLPIMLGYSDSPEVDIKRFNFEFKRKCWAGSQSLPTLELLLQ